MNQIQPMSLNINDRIQINHINYPGQWIVLSINLIRKSVKVRAESDTNGLRQMEVPFKLITL
jgi:hypothetical protein